MFQESLKMQNYVKFSLDESSHEKKLKISSVESNYSRQSRNRQQINHWDKHEDRRERRLNSLFKLRLEKLQQITEENKKIFMRLNQQQSHYNSSKRSSGSIQKSKKEQCLKSVRLFGPIGNYQIPSCFMVGTRGIMCENTLGIDNIVHKHVQKKLPQIKNHKQISINIQKQNSKPSSPTKTSQTNFLPLQKKGKLPSLYLFV